MTISVKCPHCDAALKVPDKQAGKNVECPKCKNEMSISDEPVSTKPPAENPFKMDIPVETRSSSKDSDGYVYRGLGTVSLTFGSFSMLVLALSTVITYIPQPPGTPNSFICVFIVLIPLFAFIGFITGIIGLWNDRYGLALTGLLLSVIVALAFMAGVVIWWSVVSVLIGRMR